MNHVISSGVKQLKQSNTVELQQNKTIVKMFRGKLFQNRRSFKYKCCFLTVVLQTKYFYVEYSS